MNFKTEVILLSVALALFMVSAFFYNYQAGTTNFNINWATYPYQGYSVALVLFGSFLTGAAFVKYSRRGRNMLSENLDFSPDEKSD